TCEQINVLRQSRWRETSPVGGPREQPPFLNGALTLDTTLSPQSLLAELMQIESALGRQRTTRWDARPIDLDLLLYGQEVIHTTVVEARHPRWAAGRFVLERGAEVAGERGHPTIGWRVSQLLDHKNTALPYFALWGASNTNKPALAGGVAKAVGGRFVADPP